MVSLPPLTFRTFCPRARDASRQDAVGAQRADILGCWHSVGGIRQGESRSNGFRADQAEMRRYEIWYEEGKWSLRAEGDPSRIYRALAKNRIFDIAASKFAAEPFVLNGFRRKGEVDAVWTFVPGETPKVQLAPQSTRRWPRKDPDGRSFCRMKTPRQEGRGQVACLSLRGAVRNPGIARCGGLPRPSVPAIQSGAILSDLADHVQEGRFEKKKPARMNMRRAKQSGRTLHVGDPQVRCGLPDSQGP